MFLCVLVVHNKSGGRVVVFSPSFFCSHKKNAFLGKNREKKKGRDIITHTNARAFLLLRDETFEKTTQGLSASRAAVVVVVPKKKTTFSIDVFFRAEVLRPIREREREKEREKEEWDFGERRSRSSSSKARARRTSTPRAFEARTT